MMVIRRKVTAWRRGHGLIFPLCLLVDVSNLTVGVVKAFDACKPNQPTMKPWTLRLCKSAMNVHAFIGVMLVGVAVVAILVLAPASPENSSALLGEFPEFSARRNSLV